MLDYSSLEIFGRENSGRENENIGRRDFFKGATAAGLFGMGFNPWGFAAPERPLDVVRQKRFPTLVAIVAAQIDVLWQGRQGDDACQVAHDILRIADHFPRHLKHEINVALLWLDVYSLRHTGHHLESLHPSSLRRLLNQGETPRCQGGPPRIVWCEDHLLHTAISVLAMLGRLVIHSRLPARRLIGLEWSKPCERPENAVSVDPPPQADLTAHYDVCVIGSGAGGATAAARLTAAGLHVLMLDAGDFVSPDALVQRESTGDGQQRLAPPRSDEVLSRLYKYGGAQIAGGLTGTEPKLKLIIPAARKKIPPKQTVTVLQAEVFGGGPYVNNAIHLPLTQEVYDSWGPRRPAGVGYRQLADLMNKINQELGVNRDVTENQVSERSVAFRRGCEALGEEVQPLPVSIRPGAMGCGSDNSVDSFGDHIGGVHPYSPQGANSFLMQAMHNPEPAVVSYRTRARRLRIGRRADGRLSVQGLEVCRVDESGRHQHATVTADQYVVAAGAGASTQLLRQSFRAVGLRNRHLGHRYTANVGTAVYAVFDQPLWPSNNGRPEPGVTQCYFVDRRKVQRNGTTVEEPILENWFHYPGTVGLALSGWFDEYARTMRRYNHLSMAGAVVPTKVRPSNHIGCDGELHLELDREEFELLLQGIRRIGRIYLAAATEDNGVTLQLPTKALLMRHGRPAVIRTMHDFEWAIAQIRRRGPAFLNLLTAHPQGGASLGDVVDPNSFQVRTERGHKIDNLTVADASLFPAGCEINPQLTLKALATLAAERVRHRIQGTVQT